MKHDSAQLAAEAIGGNKCSISHCASGCRGAKVVWRVHLDLRTQCLRYNEKTEDRVSKPVYQINLQTGVLIRKFESTNQTASLLKTETVFGCAEVFKKSANGFSWSYNPHF
jgi:hypothetical protein